MRLGERGPDSDGDRIGAGSEVTGTKEPFLRDIWVYSSVSGDWGAVYPGVLYPRISGSESCSGRKREVNLKDEDEDDFGA